MLLYIDWAESTSPNKSQSILWIFKRVAILKNDYLIYIAPYTVIPLPVKASAHCRSCFEHLLWLRHKRKSDHKLPLQARYKIYSTSDGTTSFHQKVILTLRELYISSSLSSFFSGLGPSSKPDPGASSLRSRKRLFG